MSNRESNSAKDDSGTPHAHGGLKTGTYILNDEVYVVYRNCLWRRTGQTRNPRVIAQADAVASDGELLTVHTDGALVELQHHIAGIEERLVASELIEPPSYATFEEVDSVDF